MPSDVDPVYAGILILLIVLKIALTPGCRSIIWSAILYPLRGYLDEENDQNDDNGPD